MNNGRCLIIAWLWLFCFVFVLMVLRICNRDTSVYFDQWNPFYGHELLDVPEDEKIDCMQWACGDDFIFTPTNKMAERWRDLHPDLPVIQDSDSWETFYAVVAKEWQKHKIRDANDVDTITFCDNPYEHLMSAKIEEVDDLTQKLFLELVESWVREICSQGYDLDPNAAKEGLIKFIPEERWIGKAECNISDGRNHTQN